MSRKLRADCSFATQPSVSLRVQVNDKSQCRTVDAALNHRYALGATGSRTEGPSSAIPVEAGRCNRW
jgi:hypothetical protein